MNSVEKSSNVVVLGGDGFCGWPTSLGLSAAGYDVTIVDNLVRRSIDRELGIESLTPIVSIYERISCWKEITGKTINIVEADVAIEYQRLLELFKELKPQAVIHFAEQRSAPYSMKSSKNKCFTINNNLNATNNVLAAIVESEENIHLVHLGTMGVYGYGTVEMQIPEGYLDVFLKGDDGELHHQEILYPTNPGSIYHLTKSQDQLLFAYYAKNDKLRITDLHQGIVWGTQTDETRLDERLINRFDYDGDFGTVLNRFLMQAAVEFPLTVHGSGGQTRAFIHIRDTVKCIEIALSNPPKVGDRVDIFNQMTETHKIMDLAKMVAENTGATISCLPNPRNEADENKLFVKNDKFIQAGMKPVKLSEGLMEEVIDIAEKYSHRCDISKIPCESFWNKETAKRAASAAEE